MQGNQCAIIECLKIGHLLDALIPNRVSSKFTSLSAPPLHAGRLAHLLIRAEWAAQLRPAALRERGGGRLLAQFPHAAALHRADVASK